MLQGVTLQRGQGLLLFPSSTIQLFLQGYDLGFGDHLSSLQGTKARVRLRALKTGEGHQLRIPPRCSNQIFVSDLDRRDTSAGLSGLTFRRQKITSGAFPHLPLVE